MKHTATPLIILLFLIPLFLPAQQWRVDRSQRTAFSLVEDASAESAADPIKDGPEYDKASEIFARLVAAKGDFRFDPPKFFIARGSKQGAFLMADNLGIGMERKAYQICQHFGDGAVAAILGHELTHFYEKHLWQSWFLIGLKNQQDTLTKRAVEMALGSQGDTGLAERRLTRANQTLQQNLIRQINESQSDYLGGFLAYSAGFDVSKMPVVLDSIYEAYGYQDTIAGYGTRQERIAMAQATQDRLEEFIDVHEVANLLLALDFVRDARVLYKGILQEYQGPEIYNNLGFLTIMEALEYFSTEEKKYRLPLELDLGFGAASRLPPGELDTKTYRNNLLNEAIGYFSSAVNLNPNYAPGYLNKAVAHYLLEDNTRAVFYADTEARQRANAHPESFPQTADNAEILLALVDLRGDSAAKAKGIARLQALAPTSPLAAANLNVANKVPAETSRTPRGPSLRISGLRGRSIQEKVQNEAESKNLQFFFEDQMKVWDKAVDHAKIYKFTPREKADGTQPLNVYLMITGQDYPVDLNEEINVGTPAAVILNEYGEPAKRLTTVTGEIWVYRDSGALLIMDKHQNLQRWVLVHKDRF